MFTLLARQWGTVALALAMSTGGGIACSASRGTGHALPARHRMPFPPNAGQTLSDAQLTMLRTGAASALDVIDRLRPMLFGRERGIDPASATALTVWLDDQRLDSAELLKEVRPEAIRRIRYLTPTEARFYFGPLYDGAVVVVTLAGP